MSTKADRFAALLAELGACSEARKWAAGKTLAEAWATCERGDWMLWFAGKMVERNAGGVTRQRLVLAACACAETAVHLVPAGEDSPQLAIDTARRWAKGDPAVSLDDVRRAAYAAEYAANAAYAAYANAVAAHAAFFAEYAAFAAEYAANAAYAAACAAAADYDAARTGALKRCADIVRKHLRVRVKEGR